VGSFCPWARKIQNEDFSLEVIHRNAAGIDIGNESHYVAVPPSRDSQPVRRYGCTTGELKAMADWLKQCGIQTVAMQSTGVYWVAVYDILEQASRDAVNISCQQWAALDAVARPIEASPIVPMRLTETVDNSLRVRMSFDIFRGPCHRGCRFHTGTDRCAMAHDCEFVFCKRVVEKTDDGTVQCSVARTWHNSQAAKTPKTVTSSVVWMMNLLRAGKCFRSFGVARRWTPTNLRSEPLEAGV
jgi:hypothetical protein